MTRNDLDEASADPGLPGVPGRLASFILTRDLHEPVARRPHRVVDGGRAVSRDVAGWRAGADGPNDDHPGAAAVSAAESALVTARVAAPVDRAAADDRREGSGAGSADSGSHSGRRGQPADRA